MKKILIITIIFCISFCPTISNSKPTINRFEGDYTLGAGDKLRITIFDEEDLSGEFEIGGKGVIAMPLIGDVRALGLNVKGLGKRITVRLKDGYLVNPRVSVDILELRPFFIMGEVKKPGSYPYVNALTVLNAVAIAGGFTHRADEKKIVIHRKLGGKSKKIEVSEHEKVYPGDTIRINERFF